MTPGQARVLGLLIFLFVLELAVYPGIKTWLQGLMNGWNTALSSKAAGGK